MTNALLLIDPQNDFCDPNGSLFVPGSPEDCAHIVEFINKNSSSLNKIFVLMDSHHSFDIAHPLFWVDANGKSPAPYTIITSDDVKNGKWTTAIPSHKSRALEYLKLLELSNSYNCCIWPLHCLIGSHGWAIEDHVQQAIMAWEKSLPGRVAEYIEKGKNIFTEHYSAVRAEVPDPEDRETMTDMQLINGLRSCDTVYVAGEALSHCVANSVNDLLEYISPENLVILKDASTSVKGFENLGDAFLAAMQEKGVRTLSCADATLQ